MAIVFVFVFTAIDECADQPCQNGGECVDGFLSYTCECRDGFDGDQCQNGETEQNSKGFKIVLYYNYWIVLKAIPD